VTGLCSRRRIGVQRHRGEGLRRPVLGNLHQKRQSPPTDVHRLMLVDMDLDGLDDPWAMYDLFEEKESDGIFKMSERQYMATLVF